MSFYFNKLFSVSFFFNKLSFATHLSAIPSADPLPSPLTAEEQNFLLKDADYGAYPIKPPFFMEYVDAVSTYSISFIESLLKEKNGPRQLQAGREWSYPRDREEAILEGIAKSNDRDKIYFFIEYFKNNQFHLGGLFKYIGKYSSVDIVNHFLNTHQSLQKKCWLQLKWGIRDSNELEKVKSLFFIDRKWCEYSYSDNEEVNLFLFNSGVKFYDRVLEWACEKKQWQFLSLLLNNGLTYKFDRSYPLSNAIKEQIPCCEQLLTQCQFPTNSETIDHLFAGASEAQLISFVDKKIVSIVDAYRLAEARGLPLLFEKLCQIAPRPLTMRDLIEAIKGGNYAIYRNIREKGVPFREALLAVATPSKEILWEMLRSADRMPDEAYYHLSKICHSEEEALEFVTFILKKGCSPTPYILAEFARKKWFNLIRFCHENGVSIHGVYLASIKNFPKAIRFFFYEMNKEFNIADFFAIKSGKKNSLAPSHDLKPALAYELEKLLKQRLSGLFPKNEKLETAEKITEEMLTLISKCNIDITFEETFESYFKKSFYNHYQRHMPWNDSFFYESTPSDRLWKKLFPDENLRALEKLSPYGFSLPVYKDLLPAMMEASRRENNNNGCLHAYKLAVLFDSKEKAWHYLEDYKKRHHSAQPVHDACLFNLPERGVWDIDLWRSRLEKQKWPQALIHLLPQAPHLEAIINGTLPPYEIVKSSYAAEYQGDALSRKIQEHYTRLIVESFFEEQPEAIPSEDRQRLIATLASDPTRCNKLPKGTKKLFWNWLQTNYKVDAAFLQEKTSREKLDRAMPFEYFFRKICEHRNIRSLSHNHLVKLIAGHLYGALPEKWNNFALTAARAGLSLQHLQEIIDTIDKNPKATEFLPDFVLYDADSNMRIEKMALNDPDLFIAGFYTGCCQSIHGEACSVVQHIAKSPFSTIIRVMNGDSWAAQGWAGLTLSPGQRQGELVIDSIEMNGSTSPQKILQLYQRAAEHLLQLCPWISRVLLGGGGGSQRLPTKNLKKYQGPINPIGGYQGGGYDSMRVRYLLAERAQDEAMGIVDEGRSSSPIKEPHNEPNLVVVNSTDAYVTAGKPLKSLTLSYQDKLALEKGAPEALKLLRKEDKNPLEEQGFYRSNGERERLGDLYLTHEAIAYLAHVQLEEKKGTDPRYQFDKIVMAKNNPEELVRQLKSTTLQEGVPLLILYTEKVHTAAAVLGMVDGAVVSFTVDSEPQSDANNVEINQAIRMAFPNAHMFCNSIRLQMDYYSCSTMAYKALRFFAKQGSTLLRTMAAAAQGRRPDLAMISSTADMPAALLKMIQGYEIDRLPHSALETIVSVKKGTTLQQYLLDNRITFAGRSFNGAALRKKTLYTHHLNDILTTLRNGDSV